MAWISVSNLRISHAGKLAALGYARVYSADISSEKLDLERQRPARRYAQPFSLVRGTRHVMTGFKRLASGRRAPMNVAAW